MTTRGRVDPVVVGYALDQLRCLAAEHPLDSLRVEVARDGHGMRVEVTAVLAGRAVRAATAGCTPRAAIDRVYDEITGQAQLVARWVRSRPHSGHDSG
ncbi:HPF/RaiA family ribosome-associated protein [Qaidamihabitans albus]|uniref:HPF/RaiA family ribosome-associated protein n=1 Tax=Qaidamihabitans albus TaxID=2795733 RepID=UPI0018F1F3C2|nr:HPF/RaiA family ribosome-associated protein [Qaidamihabitans albus]